MKRSDRKITVELMAKRGRLRMITEKGNGAIIIRAHNMAYHAAMRESVPSALENRIILCQGNGLGIVKGQIEGLPCPPTVAMLEESLRMITTETSLPEQGELF